MSQLETAPVKYIYLDVVGFTYNRPVEAQTEIIAALNDIVRQAVSDRIPDSQVVYIPVGDGICISIIGNTEEYDVHIQISEDIIRRITAMYNPSVKENRRFEVRVGINENVDNIITDINGNRNTCGFGINYAQRIMSFADPNQILVGRTTYDTLVPREKYSKAFLSYRTRAKHNTIIELYQYTGGNVATLNRQAPAAFASPPETKLTIYAAYYISHIIKNREFINNHLDLAFNVYSLAVVIAYLAEDSIGQSKASKTHPYDNHIPETPNNTLSEQFELFRQIPFWLCTDLYDAKVQVPIIDTYSYCFEDGSFGLFVSEKGKKKLQSEFPNIWLEFGF